VKYAAIHNFGGKTSPHLIKPKKGKALKFGGRFANWTLPVSRKPTTRW